MKVAHFGQFAPDACGMHSTIRDLISAERSVGIDAQFIDYRNNAEGKPESRVGLNDGDVTTIDMSWAMTADVVMRHSDVPESIKNAKPLIMALHGRPESSFKIEQNGTPTLSLILKIAEDERYKTVITFWPEHTFYWSRMLPGKKVFCVPSPVDFYKYTPQGKKHDFGGNGGKPNIVIADMWRDDTTPFNLVFAAQYFKEHFEPSAKLHIYGLPAKNSCVNFLSPLKNQGLIGELAGQIRFLPDVYRAADMIITPNLIATRIVRESLASGTPIVAPHGCQHTLYKAEPRDFKSFAIAMKRCYDTKHDRMVIRQQMIDKFHPTIVGNAVKGLCERICN